MLEQSEGDNHASKINVFLLSHTIFFSTMGSENRLICPARGNKTYFMTLQ